MRRVVGPRRMTMSVTVWQEYLIWAASGYKDGLVYMKLIHLLFGSWSKTVLCTSFFECCWYCGCRKESRCGWMAECVGLPWNLHLFGSHWLDTCYSFGECCKSNVSEIQRLFLLYRCIHQNCAVLASCTLYHKEQFQNSPVDYQLDFLPPHQWLIFYGKFLQWNNRING